MCVKLKETICSESIGYIWHCQRKYNCVRPMTTYVAIHVRNVISHGIYHLKLQISYVALYVNEISLS